jgi:Na+-transporting methylmalonyl-CoA/oxaloacetate decarboxylase beta subunit
MKEWTLKRHIIISLVIVLLVFIAKICMMAIALFLPFSMLEESSAMGIIGGADGPVAIFIADHSFTFVSNELILLLVLLLSYPLLKQIIIYKGSKSND